MAERRSRRLALEVHLDYTFDRLRAPKLAQLYELLVPAQQRLVGTRVREGDHEDGGDLRSSVLGAAARGTHDCESDGGADRVREDHDLEVPKEWVFEDEGYSGATLERPGLERVRDLAAEGQIQVVLAYAPDRLSRKYAYQILLIEELARHGVETLSSRRHKAQPPRTNCSCSSRA